jgi:NAD(P)H-nitrite reductase large subunit
MLEAELVTVDAQTRHHSRVEVDTICLGYGFQPNNELLRMLGCAHDFDPVRGQFSTRRDPVCATSLPGVFAVGDCTGLGGAPAAQCVGVLAGLAAVRICGIATDTTAVRTARRDLGRHRRFQAALWSFYAPAGSTQALTTPDTEVCRCENTTSAELDEAIAVGHRTIGAVKRKTRLGMGHCQGRYCVPVAMARLAQCQGGGLAECDLPAPHPPLRPLTIAELADGNAAIAEGLETPTRHPATAAGMAAETRAKSDQAE